VGALQHPLRDQARAFVNWLRDQGYCTTNPFERPGISKGPGRKHDKPLTEHDLSRAGFRGDRVCWFPLFM
jgi:hypothetical protein